MTGYRLMDVCNLTGATPAQLRRWKRYGWLSGAVRQGKYSHYPQGYVDRVRQIQAIYAENCFGPDVTDRLNRPHDHEDTFEYDDDGALG